MRFEGGEGDREGRLTIKDFVLTHAVGVPVSTEADHD